MRKGTGGLYIYIARTTASYSSSNMEAMSIMGLLASIYHCPNLWILVPGVFWEATKSIGSISSCKALLSAYSTY